jgi:hypothetical protein
VLAPVALAQALLLGQAAAVLVLLNRLSFANGTLSVTAVPEPHTWALMLGGLLAVGWFKRRALGA